MSGKNGIEWTESTWNPVRGCTKKSAGCVNCYAAHQANRFKGRGKPYEGLAECGPSGTDWTGKISFVEECLDEPLHWRKPCMVFAVSMGDLFHKDVPVEYIARVFDVMYRAERHTFQILTKRAERLVELAPHLPWPPNIWMGVSVESAAYVERIDLLREVPAAVRFLSLEPLLGPISHLDLSGIHWGIVGGESGSRPRPMKAEWVLDIQEQCKRARVPFFFKQWGNIRNNPDKGDPTHKQNGGKSKGGRLLNGRVWDEMPVSTADTDSAPCGKE